MMILLRPMAYLDPGSGSLIIQMVLAGLLGIAVAARIYWKKITAIFKKDKGEKILNNLDDIDEYGDDSD